MMSMRGARVLLPRSEQRAASLIAALAELGAIGEAVPVTAIAEPLDTGALDAAVLALAQGDFEWVGFTSVTAVAAVLDRAEQLRLHPVVPADTRIAAVGPATARALRAAGLPVDLVPDTAGSAATLAAIWPAPHSGDSVLLPRSSIAANTLPDALSGAGFRVRAVDAYRTVGLPVPAAVADDLAAGAFDAIVFSSPSTVDPFAGCSSGRELLVVAIGEATATAARAIGLEPVLAAEPTDAAVLATLVDHLGTTEESRT